MRVIRWCLAGIGLALAVGCQDPTKPNVIDEKEPPPDTVTATLPWLQSHSHVIDRLEGAGSDSDLVALGDMIGNARVLGMGEATHGTRESSLFKIRLFKYLVEKRGFTAFAIEATAPEAFLLDDYVRGGPGDAEQLVRRLYFWTVGGQDMVDMVRWLRELNSRRPASARVGFYGFDIQFPGMAIDSVIAFATRAGGASLGSEIGAYYSCAQPYRNDDRGQFPNWYPDAPAETRTACNASIVQARPALTARSAALTAATTASQFDRVVQLARIVEQWATLSDLAAARDAAAAFQKRDQFMTENTMWILARQPANGRVALWAHNSHVSNYNPGTSTRPIMMGHFLKTELGAGGYVILGFALDSGTFTARHGETLELMTHHLQPADAEIDAYERILRQVGAQYYVDLRAPTPGTEIATWLAGPRRLRTIGALYDELYWRQFFTLRALSTEYDLLAFIANSSPARLLPPPPSGVGAPLTAGPILQKND